MRNQRISKIKRQLKRYQKERSQVPKRGYIGISFVGNIPLFCLPRYFT